MKPEEIKNISTENRTEIFDSDESIFFYVEFVNVKFVWKDWLRLNIGIIHVVEAKNIISPPTIRGGTLTLLWQSKLK